MPPRRQGWDDDDDDDFHDRRPVFKGTRNYESFGSSLGEKIGDAVTTVAQAAGNLKEQLEREARKNDALDKLGSKFNNLGESIRQTDAGNAIQKEWAKVTSAASKAIEERRLAAEREKDQARSHSKMPPGCYCDMRGYPCPMHKGHEKWRTSTVYQQHLLYNSDGKEEGARQSSSSGQSSANGASGKDSAELDEMLAQLVSMGFDPERVVEVLSKHKSLQSATNALLDAPEPERQPPPADPPRVAISEFIGAAPKVPPPKPPKPEPESLLLFDEPVEQPQPPRNFAAELFLMSSTPLPSSTPPPAAAPPPSDASTFAPTGPAAARPPSVPFTPAGAGPMPGAPPRTGGAAGGTPHAGFPPQYAQPGGASSWPPYPEKPAAPVQADPSLPAGWHACIHASSGLPYYFNTSTQQSQWEHPALPATAANGARASQAPAQVQPPSHGAHAQQVPPQVQPPAHGAYAPPAPRQAQTPSPHGAYAPQGQVQPPAHGVHAPQAPHQAQAASSYAAPALSAPAGASWGSPSTAPQQVSASTPELPPPWHACVHPSTGIPYYFNTETQQSQWEYPGVRAPTASGASPTPNGSSSRPT